MKKILGLDIGTNSIGWAFIESNAYDRPEILNGRIIDAGSRIIPMDADALNKFETGVPESKAATRRQARGARRLNQRYKLRRGRLIQALKILGWIPKDFPEEFKRAGKHNINVYLPFSDELKKEVATFFEIEYKKTLSGGPYQISEDWIIYYLKNKAKNEPVSLFELARILYHYNQRRGYKSSRKDVKNEDEETKEIKYPLYEKWVDIVTVTSITENGKGEGKDKEFIFYEITCKTPDLEFKTIKKRKTAPEWLNKSIEFEITRKTTKDKTVNYTIIEVDPAEWESRKRALEKELDYKNQTISTYYLNQLKENKTFRIKDRIVDRSRYQDEFKKIWDKQTEFHQQEFNNKAKISEIADTFYRHNKEKNKELKAKDLFHIFFNDIIYYQRGLKSQKSLLANCQYEKKLYKDKDGLLKEGNVKVISKSAPCFQEFRIWQTIHNLRILQKETLIDGKLKLNIDVSDIYLTKENKEKLFELFDSTAEVSHDAILKTFGLKKDFVEDGAKAYGYKLNFPEDKNFQGNETKALFRRIFKKHAFEEEGEKYLADTVLLNQLWHIVYSLPDEKDIVKALNNKKYFLLPESVVKHISKLPEFKRQYAALSSKAINKLLPLMRIGKYWNESALQVSTQERIHKLLNGEFDETIPDKVRDEIKTRNLITVNDFSGLPTFLCAYVVYGRHSERANELKYETADDFKINEIIPHNSLRNPVVEKTIRETLKLVKDVWRNEKMGRPDFIHVELGRELKNNAADRQEIASANSKNRVEKERIALLLKELKYPNFNPDSPSDIDKFKIWKDNGGIQGEEEFELLFKKNNAEFIRDADIEKYRHWAEQNYRSPYTGEVIPLSELFTEKYQVDHIIPKSRFYDDSYGNKVVVEAEVNAEKANRMAMVFIDEYQGREIELTSGKKVKLLSVNDYKKFADEVIMNRKKRKYLKLYEVPEDFVERQMNDTKYISRTVAQFLRPVAGGMGIDEGLVYTSGSITADLKNKWGLTKLWKDLLKSRFERLEGILGEQLILPDDTKQGNYHFAKDYKRIDHRHHALDALVIACTTRSHIKYLNSLSSLSNNKKEISKYNEWQKWKYLLNKRKQLENLENGMTEFALPWDNFYLDTRNTLESVIVSHKPTSKLISKAVNRYQKLNENGERVFEFQKQPKDDDKYWVAVRQPMFALPLGTVIQPDYKKNVDLKKAIKIQISFLKRENKKWNTEDYRIAKSVLRKQFDKIIIAADFDEKEAFKQASVIKDEDGQPLTTVDLLCFKKYAAKRRAINESFTPDVIKKLPDAGIENNWLSKLLTEHLEQFENNPKIAFKGEELEMLYKKAPNPINKVTVLDGEAKNKIPVHHYLMEGAAGVNQFFVVEFYKEENKKTGEEELKRKYYTPPFMDCLKRLALGLPVHDEDPAKTYLVLSPGDIVYVPEEGEKISQVDWSNKKKFAERCYIMKSSTASTCYFLPISVASVIEKGEFETLNKSEKTKDGKQVIKENFVKIKVDRLGNIKPA